MSAKIRATPDVGTYVYQPFSPQKAGVITEVGEEVVTRGYHTGWHFITVKWLNGTETQTDSSRVKCFMSLVEDTERKLATHKKTIAKLDKLREVYNGTRQG